MQQISKEVKQSSSSSWAWSSSAPACFRNRPLFKPRLELITWNEVKFCSHIIRDWNKSWNSSETPCHVMITAYSSYKCGKTCLNVTLWYVIARMIMRTTHDHIDQHTGVGRKKIFSDFLNLFFLKKNPWKRKERIQDLLLSENCWLSLMIITNLFKAALSVAAVYTLYTVHYYTRGSDQMPHQKVL